MIQFRLPHMAGSPPSVSLAFRSYAIFLSLISPSNTSPVSPLLFLPFFPAVSLQDGLQIVTPLDR